MADPDVFANLWWPIGEGDRVVASHTLDRAYLTVRADPVNVIIGRQRIGWGVARFISPLDLFNPFGPMAVDTEERRGTDALVTEILLGQFTGMSLVFAPTFPMDDASYAVRLYTNRFNYDVSLVAGRFTDREVYGLDFSGQVWNIAVWGEAAWNEEDEGVTYAVADPSSPFGFSLHRSKSRYVRATLGAHYIFPNTLSVLAEYYDNGKGEMDTGNYTWEAAADGSEPALSQHYLFAERRLPDHAAPDGELFRGLQRRGRERPPGAFRRILPYRGRLPVGRGAGRDREGHDGIRRATGALLSSGEVLFLSATDRRG